MTELSFMIRVTFFIRPHRLEAVKSAVASLGVTGMTVSDVRGMGNSQETTEWFGGNENGIVPLPIRAKVEVVVSAGLADQIVAAVLDNAQTGESGDGKIFLERVEDAIRIRTSERGEAAV
jgi:nitrogen regulatory protein P-II 1